MVQEVSRVPDLKRLRKLKQSRLLGRQPILDDYDDKFMVSGGHSVRENSIRPLSPVPGCIIDDGSSIEMMRENLKL